MHGIDVGSVRKQQGTVSKNRCHTDLNKTCANSLVGKKASNNYAVSSELCYNLLNQELIKKYAFLNVSEDQYNDDLKMIKQDDTES